MHSDRDPLHYSKQTLYRPMYESGRAMYRTPLSRGFFKRNRTQAVVIVILLFGTLLLLFNIYQLRAMQVEHQAHHSGGFPVPAVEARANQPTERHPIVWVAGKKVDSGYLQHVFNVFARLGYIRGDTHSDWDVLWSHEYPFTVLKESIAKLKPHQRINHFPGSGFITSKGDLMTSGIDNRYMPKSFKMPQQKQEFLQFAEEHPNMKWVQKNNNHRGVVINSYNNMDLEAPKSFIQQYVDNPYLIDNKRFDIGIYVTLTSVDPLRVYINDGEWLIRFCPEEYFPFDPQNKNKYVISDDYTPPWQVPSLSKYYTDLGYTRKEAMFAHLRSEGHDPDHLYETLQDAIRQVYLKLESKVLAAASKYPTFRNFFEMVRFDFILDKELKVYLLEVNMSPNLSSGHFPANKLLYEQVVFGMLSLVGVARSTSSDYQRGSVDEKNMEVSSRDVRTHADVCASPECTDSCDQLVCKLCLSCLKGNKEAFLKQAYLEHTNRRSWRRIFPVPIRSQAAARSTSANSATSDGFTLTLSNQWMSEWFRGKCIQDQAWCS